jgi:hypothetical protein
MFATVQHNSLTLHESRNEKINKYVSTSCGVAGAGMVDGSVVSLLLTILDKDAVTSRGSSGANGVIERYVFSYDTTYQPGDLTADTAANSMVLPDNLLQYAVAERSLFIELKQQLPQQTPPEAPFPPSTSFAITLLAASADAIIAESVAMKQALASNEWIQRDAAGVTVDRDKARATPVKTMDVGGIKFNVVRER